MEYWHAPFFPLPLSPPFSLSRPSAHPAPSSQFICDHGASSSKRSPSLPRTVHLRRPEPPEVFTHQPTAPPATTTPTENTSIKEGDDDRRRGCGEPQRAQRPRPEQGLGLVPLAGLPQAFGAGRGVPCQRSAQVCTWRGGAVSGPEEARADQTRWPGWPGHAQEGSERATRLGA